MDMPQNILNLINWCQSTNINYKSINFTIFTLISTVINYNLLDYTGVYCKVL